jgi:hypothetical protein
MCLSYKVTLLNHKPIIEWCMTRCVIVKWQKRDTCYNKIGLHAKKNVDSILFSIVNMVWGGGAYVKAKEKLMEFPTLLLITFESRLQIKILIWRVLWFTSGNNSRIDPMAKVIRGVGHAHNTIYCLSGNASIYSYCRIRALRTRA